MKAIYLNLDAAVAAVLAGEKPVQPELPVAVTIPAGQTAAVYAQTGTGTKTADAGSNVTGIAWTFSPSLGDAIASSVSPGMSQVLSSESASVYAVTGGAFTATAAIKYSDTTLATIVIGVIVRREQASGPVDLVDFQAPAAAPTAAQINTALGGTGAAEDQPLKGVKLSGAVLIVGDGDRSPTWFINQDDLDGVGEVKLHAMSSADDVAYFIGQSAATT